MNRSPSSELPRSERRHPEPPEGLVHDALAPLDRRAFLRLIGGTAALGLAPVGCGGLPEALQPAADLQLKALSPRGYAIFTAAAMGLVGPRGADAIAAGEVQPGVLADAWLARTPDLAATLSQGLWLLELGCFPLLPKLRPFTALETPAREPVLASLMNSRLDLKRDLFKGLKSLAVSCFYADARSHALIGYPGPFGDGSVSITDAMRYQIES